MPAGAKVDFFLSRRGSVGPIAQEVAGVLTAQGYSVIVQDHDIPFTANFIEAMHEAVKNARDLVVLFTRDYEASPHTRREFTSFEADRAQSVEERRVIILRCEDVALRGLFASNVYQDLVGIDDPAERRRRILAAAEGTSQALRPPPRPFVGVPPRLGGFTGRATDLARLDTLLGGELGRVAVRGMGGVGKSALAAEYAYGYRALYAGVWWCPAETRLGLLAALAALAVELGAAAGDEADLDKAARAGLRRLAEQRAVFLLVYDNVPGPEEIADLLPAAGARVLLTSRFADWSGWADEMALDVLEAEPAAAFLQSRAGRQDGPGARLLAEALGRLPLALDHAAAYCRRTQLPFADYARKSDGLMGTLPRGTLYPRSIAATFDLAISEAVARCPPAEALMAYLAQCAPERIPLALIAGAMDDADDALAELTDMSLARHDPFEDGTPAVIVHRLVAAVAAARAGAAGLAEGAADRVRSRLAVLYPEEIANDPAAWPLCAQLTPHLLACCAGDMARDGSVAQADLLSRAGAFFQDRAAFASARALFAQALAIHERVSGAAHPDTATALGNLATLLQAQGDLAGARPLFERALAIREAALGPDHPRTATSLNGLAILLQDRGDLAGARTLFERALAIHEAARGPSHPDTATSLGNLATLLQDQGDLAGARPLFERALTIREAALGAGHPQTATSLGNVARLRQDQGDLAGAGPLFERALAIRAQALGAEHPQTAASLSDLAALKLAQGDLAGARPLFEQALAIHRATFGPAHATTAASLSNLAALLQAQRDFAGARPLFEQALAISEALLGPGHPATAIGLNNLAHLMADLGESETAAALFERAVAVCVAALGAEHPITAQICAGYRRRMGRTA
jgi:tetratricopeptide (TPR) repeat protein